MILSTTTGEKNAEIIYTFKIEGYNDDYVIYKVDDELYGAKYKNHDNNSELITELSEQEKKLINEAYLKIQEVNND